MRFIFIVLLAVLLAACDVASTPAASPGADMEARATAYYEAGLAHYAKGELERAIADYDSAIELNPEWVNAYINRGIAYFVKGDYDLAIADYDAAIDLNPNFDNPYYNRGLAFAKLGDLDRAIADYSKAIDLNPNYALAYRDRGKVHYELGNLVQANADFDQAIALQPAILAKAAENQATPKFTATVGGSSVPMFEWPGAAQMIYSLSRGTVTIMSQHQNCKWLQIVTNDGKQGWIQTSSGNVSWLSAACSEIPPGHFRPESSVLADTFPKKGRGKLEIKNGGTDAVVVLTTLDQSVQQSAYVRSGDTFTMRLIPDGNYELYFMSGIDWNGQQFMMHTSASKFADSFPFETIREDDRRIRRGWQVTLYPVSDGNAETIPLDPEEFPIIAVE